MMEKSEESIPTILRASDGFTLVEIMLTVGLLLMIAFGVSELIVGTLRQETDIKLKQEVYNHQQQIRYESKVISLPTSVP
jgi:Tfp pilus assembly protein PilV